MAESAEARRRRIERLRKQTQGGEQTQPEYDESKDVPPPPPPPPPEPDQPHPVYPTAPPVSSHPSEQVQPWTPPAGDPTTNYDPLWEWAKTQPGFAEATQYAPFSTGQQDRVTGFINSLVQTLGHDVTSPFMDQFANYIAFEDPHQNVQDFTSRLAGEGAFGAPAEAPTGQTPFGGWWEAPTTQATAFAADPTTAAAQEAKVMTLAWPVSDYRVTGHFGDTGGAYPDTGHIGLDIVPTDGDWNVYAPQDGEIITNDWSSGYGWYTRIRHANGTVTLYAHQARQSPLGVGSQVQAGQDIGDIGATGHADGAHLHFEVYDPDGNRYDPEQWLSGAAQYDPANPVTATPQPSSPTVVSPDYQAPTAPPTGGKWTSQDAVDAIWYYGRQFGYSDSFIQFALAIAYGESGMNPYAHGDVDIGGSYGIFQFYTNGGRGDGHSLDELYNPYFESQINLPILYEQYKRFGGDEGWASDPSYVLRNGWKYGQGSIWPQDHQITSALAYATGGAGTPSSTSPSPAPQNETPWQSDPGNPTGPGSMYLYNLMSGMGSGGGYGWGGSSYLRNLLGGGSGFGGNSYLGNLLGSDTGSGGGVFSASDFLSNLLR